MERQGRDLTEVFERLVPPQAQADYALIMLRSYFEAFIAQEEFRGTYSLSKSNGNGIQLGQDLPQMIQCAIAHNTQGKNQTKTRAKLKTLGEMLSPEMPRIDIGLDQNGMLTVELRLCQLNIKLPENPSDNLLDKLLSDDNAFAKIDAVLNNGGSYQSKVNATQKFQAQEAVNLQNPQAAASEIVTLIESYVPKRLKKDLIAFHQDQVAVLEKHHDGPA